MSLLPSVTELAALTTVSSLWMYVQLDESVWNAFSAKVGGITSVRVLAAMPADLLKTGIAALRIPLTAPATPTVREATPVEVIQVGLIWRIARQSVGLPDVDPLQVLGGSSSAPQPASSAAPSNTPHYMQTPLESPSKRVKTSAVLDQADYTEIQVRSSALMMQHFANHVEVTGAEPLSEVEPTPEQVSAMFERIVVKSEAPYADFSVLTPFGRRLQRTMKTRSWLLQQDGTWKALDVPGPPSFEAWQSCFRVYKAILFMLRYDQDAVPGPGSQAPRKIVSPASIEMYYENFRALSHEFPEAWHLCMSAEDRMRGEHLERIKRLLDRALLQGQVPLGIVYNAANPWDGVFQYAAQDAAFWDANVRRPALTFLARNRQVPRFEDAAVMNASAGAQQSLYNAESSNTAGQGTKRPAAVQQEKGRQETVEVKWGGVFHTGQCGTQICYEYAKGERGSCSEPCQTQKLHSCQKCLGKHRNNSTECRVATPGKGGKGGKGPRMTEEDSKLAREKEAPRKGEEESAPAQQVPPWKKRVTLTGSAATAKNSPNLSSPSRRFRFGEFFAGAGGLTMAIREASAEIVEAMTPLDWWGNWDVTTDEGYASAVESVADLDHGHFAPPCKSLSKARRTDKHGSAKVLRTEARPEGLGDPKADEGNLIVARTVKNVELIELDQCPYGAETPKPIGILTNAVWMKTVCHKCKDAPPHRHLVGGLQGKCWDYSREVPTQVWRTSLAEYPEGLCTAWASALEKWVQSPEGVLTLARSTFTRTGVHGNALVRLAQEKVIKEKPVEKKVLREQENAEAWGGLRDPRKASAKSPALRTVGARIGRALTKVFKQLPEVLKMVGAIGTPDWNKQGFKPDAVLLARQMLTSEFGWGAGDVGFPLGIEEEIKTCGIFPTTSKDSASVEASRCHGQLVEDWSGEATNYTSFEEAGDMARKELDRVVEHGWADKVLTWSEVVQVVGPGAKLTKMACLIKTKPDGSLKIRLIVDMRRSGVNGLMVIRERIVLPRVTDVTEGTRSLLREAGAESDETIEPEFLILDFSDAFYTCHLATKERQYAIVKGQDGAYYVLKVVAFGFASGPLLWGRLAAAAMRFGQATAQPGQLRSQCCVDDPILVAAGRCKATRTIIFAKVLLLWAALGFKLALEKAQRGKKVAWIGFQLTLTGKFFRDTLVELAQDKTAKLKQSLVDCKHRKGVIAVAELVALAGLLGWVGSMIPVARPWTAQIWAAISDASSVTVRKRTTARIRKGHLCFAVQVAGAVDWLLQLVNTQQRLSRLHRFWPSNAHNTHAVSIRTDASPFGMGGMLGINGVWMAYCLVRVAIESDSTSALQASMTLRAHSPQMNRLSGEVALELEANGLDLLWGAHISGADNYLADALSRLSQGASVPECLRDAEWLDAIPRDTNFY
ncbi:unnamed protein product, partial [Polarella glacialis]